MSKLTEAEMDYLVRVRWSYRRGRFYLETIEGDEPIQERLSGAQAAELVRVLNRFAELASPTGFYARGPELARIAIPFSEFVRPSRRITVRHVHQAYATLVAKLRGAAA